jgi:hypothetical protein
MNAFKKALTRESCRVNVLIEHVQISILRRKLCLLPPATPVISPSGPFARAKAHPGSLRPDAKDGAADAEAGRLPAAATDAQGLAADLLDAVYGEEQ